MSALRKVLVVDDDAVVGKSFSRVLSEKKGYVVTTAQNAHEALKQMRAQNFDLVFTDIKMPGMDGLELTERVKSDQPWVPVVIITGYGSTENEVRARAVGVCEFVRKPLSPEMIETSAASALREGEAAAARMVQDNAASTTAQVVATAAQEGRIKNIALFLVAPFIGLAYALTLPLVGLVMLARVAGQAWLARPDKS